MCSNNNTLVQFCGPESDSNINGNFSVGCISQACPRPYEYTLDCFCAAPLVIDFRLKSPGFSDFRIYMNGFRRFMSSSSDIDNSQLHISSFSWEQGPRLRMELKIFPMYVDNTSSPVFNRSEVLRIKKLFLDFDISSNDLFGPFEFLGFSPSDVYRDGKSPKRLLLC